MDSLPRLQLEARFAATFNQAAVGMAHVNLDGTFILLNQKFCEIAGYPEKELLSLQFQDITYAADLQVDMSLMQDLLAGRIQTYSMEKRYIRKSKLQVWVNLTVSLVRSPDQTPLYFIAVIEEIGQRKTAETALQQLHAELEAKVRERTVELEIASELLRQEIQDRQDAEIERSRFFTISIDAMIIFNDKGEFQKINPAFGKIMGYSKAEILGRPASDFIHPDDREMTRKVNADFRVTHFLSDFENRYLRKDGRPVSFSWTASYYPEKCLTYAVARDVTRLREQEMVREKERSQTIAASKMQSLGRMAAGVAHEINNPLTVVSGQAYRLQKMLASGEMNRTEMQAASQQIENMSRRIVEIINGLRTFAREGSGDPFAFVQLKRILDETLSFCQGKIFQEGITLQIQEIPENIEVHCRSVQISQVLLNFLNNARDALENYSDKTIQIQFISSDTHVGICVQDNGTGVPGGVGDLMFEPFFTTKDPGKGTGLGLSVSKGILSSHSGEIFYEPAQPRGSRFGFLLPRVS